MTTTIVRLTKDQELALTKLKDFVLESKEKYFRLSGYAGTGKTFLICQFIHWLKEKKLNFVAASPTNKASKNLADIARENGIELSTNTIAQLLGQQPVLCEETGVEEFLVDESKSLAHYDVILLDEYSMISKYNYEQIQKSIIGKTKVVFIGDAAQLPPVNESDSVVNLLDISSATLSEVVRYDGAIAQVAEEIRSNPRYNYQVYPFKTTEDETIICLSRDKWLEKAGKMFVDAVANKHPNYCRFLVWRNKTAEQLNNWVRTKLWGKNCAPYVVGDRLIAKKPVFRSIYVDKRFEWRIIMGNSEECTVIGEPKLCNKVGWDYWNVPVITDNGGHIDLLLLTPEFEEKRQQEIKSLQDKRKWRDVKDLEKAFDNLLFAYAITTHKAQGSSIDYIFLDTEDMRSNRSELQRLLYTAVTRTKKAAFVLG